MPTKRTAGLGAPKVIACSLRSANLPTVAEAALIPGCRISLCSPGANSPVGKTSRRLPTIWVVISLLPSCTKPFRSCCGSSASEKLMLTCGLPSAFSLKVSTRVMPKLAWLGILKSCEPFKLSPCALSDLASHVRCKSVPKVSRGIFTTTKRCSVPASLCSQPMRCGFCCAVACRIFSTISGAT